MRIVKEAGERKQEILDAAAALFSQKGFDQTSITDIIERVGVARGTVYYHFKSKEDVMDALIERHAARLFAAAREAAADKSRPALERLFASLAALSSGGGEEFDITADLHKPQNALMHEKSHSVMLAGIPPILAEIVKDGIREGVFDTPYPYETVELVIAHVNTVFDHHTLDLTEAERRARVEAFIFNLERLFGAKTGSFAPVFSLFHMENND